MRRVHQVWSSGDEDEETNNKRNRGKLYLVARKGDETEDWSTKLKKIQCFMEKDGNINIVEQVIFMILSNHYA